MARRAALYNIVRKNNPNVLALDGGNLFGNRKESERRQTEFLCEETAKLNYDAFGVGPSDLNYGLDFTRKMASQYGFEFVSANLRDRDGKLIFDPYVVREVGGVKIGIVSVISPSYRIVTMTSDTDGFKASDPREALDGILPEIRAKTDLVVLLAQMPTTNIREMLTAMGPGSGIDICIEGRDARQYRRINRVNGDILLLAANNEGKYVGQLDLVLNKDKKIDDAVVTVHALDGKAPEIDALREKVDKFKAENAEDATAKLTPFVHMRGNGDESERFLGIHTCANCHTQEARVYAQTKHAQAFNTLVAKGQERNEECVGCHVTGFDWINGYDQVADSKVPGRESLKNVQCEACHGYGTQHDRTGAWLKAARETCVLCHDSANSPDFDYATYWAKIQH